MNNKVKKQLLVATIIVLFIINVSALITIFYNSKVKESKIENAEIQKEQMRIQGMYRYFQEELNLTDEQYVEFQNINKEITSLSHDIAIKLQENRILILEEVAKENPDFEKMDLLAKEIGKLHYELKNNTIKQFIELKTLCNKDQQVALQKIFMQMIDEQDRGKFRGRNRHERSRKGRPRHPR